LPGVQAGADLDAELADALSDGTRRAHSARRSVEACEESVSGGIDLLPPEAHQLAADPVVVGIDEVVPPAIAKCQGPLRRADDIGEQHRRKHSIVAGSPPRARQELLD